MMGFQKLSNSLIINYTVYTPTRLYFSICCHMYMYMCNVCRKKFQNSECVGLSQDHPFVCCTSLHIFLVLQVNSYSRLHADTNKIFVQYF